VSCEISELVERCRTTLSARPAGLLTDIDGTISWIAPTPESASVGAEAIAALQALQQELDIVGAVTGRAAENAEAMIGVPGLIYVGNHGLEERIDGVTHVNPAAVVASSAVAESMALVRTASETRGVGEGILYENKGVSGSIHYRLAPDQESARLVLLDESIRAAGKEGLKVSEGRMVVELRPSLAINKGTAIASLIERHSLRSLVFFGDDVTDIDGFNTVRRLRDEGKIAGLNIAVVAPETSPEVAAAADVAIPGVECCIELLTALAHSWAKERGDHA
jgi:trehalose 6-phosphate phosphatase